MPGFTGWLATTAGRIAQIGTTLFLKDRTDSWKARWGIQRMSWLVPPGLYAIGTPGSGDPVLVTANYKMSYDTVRYCLAGRSIWLLVLETYGINVWCAAGKGTFGTDELVRRVTESRLPEIVIHRNLILPILGAPGVAAHDVSKRCGFRVHYATIRAADIPEYLDNGMITTPAMREMTFSLRERAVLIPVELVTALKPTGIAAFLLLAVVGLTMGMDAGIMSMLAYLGAVLTGIVAAPLLLPVIPGRSFALKGAVAGALWSAVVFYLSAGHFWWYGAAAPVFLALPAISSFHALNFTGCTPYTSRSGVKKEMRVALPIMGGALLAAAVLAVAGAFV